MRIVKESERQLTDMFDAAASGLTEEDRDHRDLVMTAFADRE